MDQLVRHPGAMANRIVQSDESKICVVMVGLPARGKSLIAGKGMIPPIPTLFRLEVD